MPKSQSDFSQELDDLPKGVVRDLWKVSSEECHQFLREAHQQWQHGNLARSSRKSMLALAHKHGFPAGIETLIKWLNKESLPDD